MFVVFVILKVCDLLWLLFSFQRLIFVIFHYLFIKKVPKIKHIFGLSKPEPAPANSQTLSQSHLSSLTLTLLHMRSCSRLLLGGKDGAAQALDTQSHACPPPSHLDRWALQPTRSQGRPRYSILPGFCPLPPFRHVALPGPLPALPKAHCSPRCRPPTLPFHPRNWTIPTPGLCPTILLAHCYLSRKPPKPQNILEFPWRPHCPKALALIRRHEIGIIQSFLGSNPD